MPFIGPGDTPEVGLYQCSCGNIFELAYNATRCPCECHKEQFEKAKAMGLWCEVCDFSTLDAYTFQQHFSWATHQKAALAKGLAKGERGKGHDTTRPR